MSQISDPKIKSDSTDDEEQEDLSVDINWQAEDRTYEVISKQEGGFDRITRPDLKSAQHACKVHERATGNFASVNVL